MRGAAPDRLGPLGRIFLDVEDGVTHMHLGSCAVFEGPPPGGDEILALISERLRDWAGYRRRLRPERRNGGRTDWIDDTSFDASNHVRRCSVPAPGGDKELWSLIGELMSIELDRRRPLWEVWTVDGLDGRWALVIKIHHSLVDGIAGAELLGRVLDVERHPDPGAHPPTTRAPGGVRDVAPAAPGRSRQPAPAASASGSTRPARRHPRALAVTVRDAIAGGWAVGCELRPRSPALSINGMIGPRRRWAVAHATLDDLAAIRAVFGGTVNDVVLAVIAGAFRDLLVARGDETDNVALRSLIPVSVRQRGDDTADKQIAAMIVDLPAGIADPAERLVAVRYRMNGLKASHQTDATQAMTALAGRAPPALLSLAVRSATAALRHLPQRGVSTITTNVPGPPVPLYALGREMVELLPYVPITQGLRLGVAVVSYNGQLRFGVTADYDTVPEVAWFCTRIEAGITELRRLATETGHRTTSSAR